MIQYIKRQELDILKYDACIEKSKQSRIYGFSWYLDIVAGNWDVLVLDEYKAVLPLPWKSKYFIKYISQPLFCQQLGVFSVEEIPEELLLEMLNSIPKKFKKISLNFNSENVFISGMEKRTNYVLELNDEYLNLLKKFSKGRKHAVKVGEKKKLLVQEAAILDLIDLKEKFYPHISFNKPIIINLANYCLEQKKGYLLGVYNGEELLGGGFFLKSNNRIIYLFSSFNNEGRKLQAASFLISHVIKKYENSNYVLDFEGSNIPNIGSFFKSFGASNISYHHMQFNNIPTLF